MSKPMFAGIRAQAQNSDAGGGRHLPESALTMWWPATRQLVAWLGPFEPFVLHAYQLGAGCGAHEGVDPRPLLVGVDDLQRLVRA